jgi:signal transduction histidine kinase
MTNQFDPLLTALENERRYVARELHDSVAQTTLQLNLQVGLCRKLMEAGKLEMLANELAHLEERSQLASVQVREIISDMRPPKVDPQATLDEYIQHTLDIHVERGGATVTYKNEWTALPCNFTSTHRLTLMRIIQETLLNIRKHAKANNVQLTLAEEDDRFLVIIADDGQGFDPVEVEARAVDKGGAGLANLRARAEAMGGDIAVARNILGQGTKVTLTLPK